MREQYLTQLKKLHEAMLEMGELCQQAIGELAVYLKELPVHYKLHLEQMAAEAIKMVNRSIDAFVRRDLTLAGEVIAYDDVVDQYFVQIKDEVIALISKDNTMGAYCIDLLMVAKYLERIADHATNIAEWVEYSILGRRPKDGVLPQSEL